MQRAFGQGQALIMKLLQALVTSLELAYLDGSSRKLHQCLSNLNHLLHLSEAEAVLETSLDILHIQYLSLRDLKTLLLQYSPHRNKFKLYVPSTLMNMISQFQHSPRISSIDLLTW
jgi:hypothetical protein